MGKTGKFRLAAGLLVLALAIAAAVFFQKKPILTTDNNPRITAITASFGQGGETYDCYIPKEEISEELNDALLAVLLDAQMRRRLLPSPNSYSILEGSMYLNIHVSLENSEYLSMHFNLGNHPDYNSAQFGDTRFHTIDSQSVYQSVYDVLADILPAYAVPW